MIRDISAKDLDNRMTTVIELLKKKSATNAYFELEAKRLEKAQEYWRVLRKGASYKCNSEKWVCEETHYYGMPDGWKPEQYDGNNGWGQDDGEADTI